MFVKDFFKKSRVILEIVTISLVAMAFSGCLSTYKFMPSESSQGSENADKREVRKDNVRTARVYNQWSTEAIFDVLWVSDQARQAYVDFYCTRRGMSDIQRSEKLEKERSSDKDKVIFYVLADVRDKLNPSLSETDPAWTFYLSVGGVKVPAKSVKEVELGSEIQALFGDRYRTTKFKTSYLVEFSAQSVGASIAEKKPLKMIISSVRRKCVLGWQGGNPVLVKHVGRQKKNGRVSKDEDYYWF